MNGNSAHWISQGKLTGLDLQFLYQDKTKWFDFLEQLGLPTPLRYAFPQISNINHQIFDGKRFFCRLVPQNPADERPYHLSITSKQEFEEFVHPYEQQSFREVQFIEKGDILYTGAIIAGKEQCILELVEGDGPQLFHGQATPVHAQMGLSGVMKYSAVHEPTFSERKLLFRAFQLVGGPRHPFPGYYEFEIDHRERLIFRNYQSPESAYGKLET